MSHLNSLKVTIIMKWRWKTLFEPICVLKRTFKKIYIFSNQEVKQDLENPINCSTCIMHSAWKFPDPVFKYLLTFFGMEHIVQHLFQLISWVFAFRVQQPQGFDKSWIQICHGHFSNQSQNWKLQINCLFIYLFF